jgi:hypothetical protein
VNFTYIRIHGATIIKNDKGEVQGRMALYKKIRVKE